MEQKVELKTTAFQENSNEKRKFQNLNSWSNRHNHNRHSMIFGTERPELLNDEHISKKIVQQLIGIIFGMITIILYISSWFFEAQEIELYIACSVFGAITVLCFIIIFTNNISIVVTKRLFKESNVIIIIILCFTNLILDIVADVNGAIDIFLGIIYLMCTINFVFLDAVKIKNRYFVIIVGLCNVLLNIVNIYGNTLGNSNYHKVLFTYTIQGESHSIMKRSTKRSLYLQILLFISSGVWTMFKDKKMELLMFATSHIYRESGDGSKNNDSTTTTGGTDNDDDDNNNSINIHNTIIKSKRRNAIILGGEMVLLDKNHSWRTYWGQRGIGIFGILGVLCFIWSDLGEDGTTYVTLTIFAALFGTLAIASVASFFYKNISSKIVRLLLKETSVAVILFLGFCNLMIDIFVPSTSLSWILGTVYLSCNVTFLFLDSLKMRTKTFIICIGTFFVVINLYNLYEDTLGDAHVGTVIFKYSLQGNDYTIMKRSAKRNIYSSTLLFSVKSLYTLVYDKKMELMMFATGKIYLQSGTSSKYVEQESFVRSLSTESNHSRHANSNDIGNNNNKKKNANAIGLVVV